MTFIAFSQIVSEKKNTYYMIQYNRETFVGRKWYKNV